MADLKASISILITQDPERRGFYHKKRGLLVRIRTEFIEKRSGGFKMELIL